MRSIQIHPPLSFPHKLTTGHQPLSKTRRGRNIMHTPSGPPVAAPGRSALFGCGFRKKNSITVSRDRELVHSAGDEPLSFRVYSFAENIQNGTEY